MKPKKAKKTASKSGTRKRTSKRAASPKRSEVGAEAPAATPPSPAETPPVEELPPILLEGDEAPPPPKSGPGERYVAGPTPAAPSSPALIEPEPSLPTAYGTRRVFAAPRDPHRIYVHWDLTDEQLAEYHREAADGHLTLRIHKDQLGGRPVQVIDLPPNVRYSFVAVQEPGTTYVAELGFYHRWGGRWTTVSTSNPTRTPRVGLAPEAPVEFRTLATEPEAPPVESPLEGQAEQPMPTPWPPGPEYLRERAEEPLRPTSALAGEEVPAAELAAMVLEQAAQAAPAGSIQAAQWGREMAQPGAAAAELAEQARGEAWSAEVGISSPAAAPEAPEARGFWFSINAELIVYGATDPDASVELAGRRIRLRPDGTFTCRFALPDGAYELVAVARSADGVEQRTAKLGFRRRTEYGGEVQAHPQEPDLSKPPGTSETSGA